MIIDISPVISERIGVFPGDVPYRRITSLQFSEGDHLDLSALHTTVHLGAHADAPSHYDPEGVPIHERSLDRYLGPCQVIAVDVGRGERIRPEHVQVDLQAPRLLFRTGTFPDPEQFNTDFASLSPDLIAWAHEQVDAVLVGIDTPSIDPCDDEVLHTHKAVARLDLAVLEGLALAGVEPGLYTLVALPLKLEGADGSPVRAVLLPTGALQAAG